jgi:SnoaL-like domain
VSRHDDLVDDLEIRDLVHRYADASSRRDPAGVASTFTSDGEWRATEFGHYRGRDALVSFFTTMLEDWNAFFQGLLSGVVVLDAADPNRAKGRSPLGLGTIRANNASQDRPKAAAPTAKAHRAGE